MNHPTENVTRIAPAKPKSVKEKSALTVMQERFGGVAQLVARRNSQRVCDALREWQDLSARFDGDRERALSRLEKIPSLRELGDQFYELHDAIFEPASEMEVRAILGLMLEGIPAAASGATPGYGDALAFSVMHEEDDRGFSAAVLFATACRLWTTSTYTPSIAEVLECARKVRAQYYSAYTATNVLLNIRWNAEDVVADTDPVDDDASVDPDEIPF